MSIKVLMYCNELNAYIYCLLILSTEIFIGSYHARNVFIQNLEYNLVAFSDESS